MIDSGEGTGRFPAMKQRQWKTILAASLPVFCLAGLAALPAPAQESRTNSVTPANVPAPVMRLTLEEAKQRILGNNKLLHLAAMNVRSKEYATRAVQANYFPQIVGTAVYFHFNDQLGSVATFGGRTFRGPLGNPIGTIPTTVVSVPLIEQDTFLGMVTAVQPITDLLKVRAGVQIARADEQIAQAQMEKGTRELLSGVEQLFWGLLAAEKIRAGTLVAIQGAELLAQTGSLEAKTALLEARQGLQEVENQIADLREQLAILLDVPTCTNFELVEPSFPAAPVACADEAVALALASSPEIREAEQNICKGRAAVAAAKVDYLPNVALMGGYLNNNSLEVIQPNIGFAGAIATWTFVDWGKRRNTIKERDELVGMATLKVQQTQDQVRQNALKSFREYNSTAEALKLAEELVAVRTQSQKAATKPADQFKTAKDLMTAQVDYVKADLAHRIAYVKLMALLGK
jgi:outer membrane protein TolC